MPAHPDLVAHSKEFARTVAEIAPGIWGFIGFAASNVYVIEGDAALAVIDTTESTGAAENILAEIRARTKQPIETIFYTHSHRDHISGASVFAEGGAPEIVAWHGFSSDIVGDASGPAKALLDRTRRQFGFDLSFPDERVNLGLGPGDRPLTGMGAGHLPPTRLIHETRFEMTLAGCSAEVIHAPGETPDHLIIWLAEHRLLISGDNYYHAFPNLYPIRGSAYRDFNAWAATLDMMLDFEAEALAPGHSQPVRGAAAIRERLTDYRDAIRYIIDETAARLNRGETPDEIGATIALPDGLRDKPWLQEFYGRVGWSAKAYAAGTLGWFDGNPTNLARLAPADEARRMIVLAGGAQVVLEAAKAADDPQWAMELADRLIAASELATQATEVKVAAMRLLADREINATARNYYLVSAADLEAAS